MSEIRILHQGMNTPQINYQIQQRCLQQQEQSHKLMSSGMFCYISLDYPVYYLPAQSCPLTGRPVRQMSAVNFYLPFKAFRVATPKELHQCLGNAFQTPKICNLQERASRLSQRTRSILTRPLLILKARTKSI